MAGLSLLLLGPFQVSLDGQPVTGFESHKVRGLLAYLAAGSARPHARDTLAGLLWPDYPQRSALNNLRSALANLRQAIGDRAAQPPYLLITRDTLQFNEASAHTLDIAALRHSRDSSVEQLEGAAAAYRGSFMEGFSLPDSPPFEEWLRSQRTQAAQQMLAILQRLAAHYEGAGDYPRALVHARRALELEPWQEEAHRQVMRALALSGQRGSALAHYESCCRLLQDELDVEPAFETVALYESIRAGTLQPLPRARGDGEGALVLEPPAPGEPPFKGLSFFDEADAALFFGREQLTALLAGQVRACLAPGVDGCRVVAVIGASGSGKSSIVRAGLVPALKSDRPPAPGDPPPVCPGRIAVFTPTARPLEALAVALTGPGGSLEETAALLDSLAGDARSLHLAATRLAQRDQTAAPLVLVVDQFEEVFSLCHDEGERRAFIANLLYAAGSPGPVTAVIALRADFYAHCAPYESLRQALCAHQLYIGAMTAAEMRRAITEPARLGGWGFEPGLVDLFLRDVGDEPGALPLLSHALLETWRRRRGRTLTLAGYQEAGGVHGAIAQTAETLFNQLTPAQQAIARHIFLRLAEPGEGAGDEQLPALFTRRRAALDELVPQPDAAPEVQAVLNKLANARLVTAARDTVEVAHEALLHEWARLRGWLLESRAGLRLHRQLTAAAREWERLDRDRGALYRGVRLAQAAEWAQEHAGELSAGERLFVETSLAAQQARQQRELEAAQTLAAEQRRRAEAEAQRAAAEAGAAARLRRRAIWLAGAGGALALLLLVAAGLGLLAARNARAAQEQTRLATSRELAAAAANNLQLDPERSVLLALQALATADTLQARNALHQALPELHVLRTIPFRAGGVPGVAISPDGSRVAAIGVDASTAIWELASGEQVLAIPGDPGEMGYDVAYSPDGTRLAATWGAQVTLWDAANGERLAALPGVTAGTVRRLEFSPDGQRLAVASMDGLPRVWDVASAGELLALSGHTQFCEAVTYSPDGRRLATGDAGGAVKIWDAQNGRELLSFEHGGSIHGLDFSPDGTQLAVASDNARLGIWDAARGEPLFSLPVPAGIYDVAYMPDGKRLVATHQDGTTTLWDPLSGQQLLLLAGHTSTVISAAASPDNDLLVTGGYDGTLKLWDTNPGRELLTVRAHDDQVYDIAYSPDGSRVATAAFDGKARLWDAATGLLARSLPPEEPSSGLSSLALSPDGSRLAFGSWDGAVYVTDLQSNQVVLALAGHMGPVPDLVFSPDGLRLATASWDGSARVWDLDTGEALLTLYSKDDLGASLSVSGVAFGPDGRQVFTAGDDDFVHQWDVATGEEVRRFDGGGLDLYGVAVSPDGRTLAVGRQDGVVLLWDIATGEKLHELSAHAGLVLRLAFSNDGSRLASVGFDSLAKVWDVATGQELVTLYGHTGNVFGAAFSPDGRTLATAGGDGTMRFYILEQDELVALARERVSRELTAEECRLFLHLEECPVAPGSPAGAAAQLP